jgi:bacillopeptidase F (M6 metalloprotease family)
MYQHKQIKKFQISVNFLDDSDMIRVRNQYENLLVGKMKEQGYVRVLDIDTAFSVEFTGETWQFLMTIQGIYVGRRKAWQSEGVTQGKLIPRNTPKVTLSQS